MTTMEVEHLLERYLLKRDGVYSFHDFQIQSATKVYVMKEGALGDDDFIIIRGNFTFSMIKKIMENHPNREMRDIRNYLFTHPELDSILYKILRRERFQKKSQEEISEKCKLAKEEFLKKMIEESRDEEISVRYYFVFSEAEFFHILQIIQKENFVNQEFSTQNHNSNFDISCYAKIKKFDNLSDR